MDNTLEGLSPEGVKSESDTSYYNISPEMLPLGWEKKSKISKNKKRFSDEQIKSLELIFESETTKLEAKKKLQLAKELGLTPRQVAIWFQNKRARWKTKQIEQEYVRLKASYDNLASRYDLLIKEKQALIEQLQKLSEIQGKPQDKEWSCSTGEGSGGGGSDHNKQGKYESQDLKPNEGLILMEQRGEQVIPQDDNSIPADKSMVPPSPNIWSTDLGLDCPSNMSFNNQQWLNFWT
ncbi:hypothetical protein ACFE04_010407 [Oxalis oulophora]